MIIFYKKIVGLQKNKKLKPSTEYTKGIFYALICYLTWGMFPLFWKQLASVDSMQVFSHRIIWSFAFIAIIIFFSKRKKYLTVLKYRTTWIWLTITGLLIGTNWLVYIYAVNNGHIVDSSFGYYINPLVNVALGMIILKEKLTQLQVIAIILALIGVIIMAVRLGEIPIISLVLAITFALYGLFRKMAGIESFTALFVETIVLFPLAFGWIFYCQNQGNNAFASDFSISALLIIGGILTAIPLLWFGKATSRIPLSTIGFIQYLSPSLQLLLGVFVYKEKFNIDHIISFGFVWAALVIFTVSIIKQYKKSNNL